MESVDVLIVGAGIAGASLAWRLAPRRRVLLLEREAQPGYHTTGRSAAMFMESYGPPGLRALTRASRAFYERPPEGFCEGPLLAPRGALYVAMHGEAAQLDAMQRELEACGAGLERLDAAAAMRLAPCLRAERIAGALYEAAAEDIDVHALHQGFLRGFRRAGGLLWTGAEALQAAHDGSAWTVTLADGRRVRAATVVNAAGAWADEIAARFGARPIGLEPRRRSAFTFRAPEGVDVSRWPAVCAVDESWYFKPDAGRLLGSPANADPMPPHDVRPEELDIALGIARIQEATTLAIRRPESTWAGLRSFVADGEIVIGFDDACPGFFWLAAQGGYGIQSAAGASACAAWAIEGGAIPDELATQGLAADGFSPRRLR